MSSSPEQLTRLYARIARDLSYGFDGVFTFESVVRVVAEVRVDLDAQSRIKDFLPVLVERAARDRLVTVAGAEWQPLEDVPELVFLGPDDRVVLAAALTRHLVGTGARVHTAGPPVASRPEIDSSLAELGITVPAGNPRPPDDLTVLAADVVVTLGYVVSCPLLPGKRYRDWDVLNPAGEDDATVRVIRDDVLGRVSTLVGELGL